MDWAQSNRYRSAEARDAQSREQARLQRLVDALENLDDVQNVYSTAVLD